MKSAEEKWQKSLRLEQRIAYIQSQQALYGVLFDEQLAYDTMAELDDEIACIEHQALQELPLIVSKSESKFTGDYTHKHGGINYTFTKGDYQFVKKVFKKDGTYTKAMVDYWGDNVASVSGVHSRVAYKLMNFNSAAQVKKYLLSVGWKPTEWNLTGGGTTRDPSHPDRTSPKITEDSFKSVAHLRTPSLVGKRAVLVHRRQMINNIKKPMTKGWLSTLRPDGRLSAEAIPQATNTGRYRHRVVVNVPKASDKVIYGERMRSLFIVPEGKLMLGCDAAALEARMEAHYCYPFTGGVAYAHELLDGDIHEANAKLFGTDRDGAKAPKYAMTYGAQPPKLAATLQVPLARAREIYNNFWEGNTALAEFRDTVTDVWQQRGYLYGVDGRKIFIRSKHAIVNAMFQSAGSITVKVATLFLNKWVRERGLDAHQILHMHDEFQWEIFPEDEEVMTELALRSFEKAGEFLNMKVPILGDVKVGKNWAETH